MNLLGGLLNFRRDMSAWSAWDRHRRIFAVAAAAVGVASIFYALTLRFDFFGPRPVTAIDDIGEAVAAAIASAACAWAASRAQGRNRVGWALIGVSAGLWAAGEVVWSIYEVVLGQQVPSPSLADVGFLAAVPLRGHSRLLGRCGWDRLPLARLIRRTDRCHSARIDLLGLRPPPGLGFEL